MNYLCNLCNTTYKTNKTLLNHNNKFHNDEIKTIFSCPHCDNKFTRKNNMTMHIKNKCKMKNDTNKSEHLEKQIIEIQKKLVLLENNNNNNTTNNINNGTINNIIYINKTGTENLLELNDKETTEIFSKEISGVVSLIKFINFNERLPSNHSFCTKSLEGKYLLTYNTEESKVESTRKKYFYQELLSTAVDKMELLFKACRNNFSKDKQTKIEGTIKRLKEIKDRDFSDKILKEIKNQLIQLSYNCRNTVLNTWDNNNIKGKQITDSIEEIDASFNYNDIFIDDNNDNYFTEIECGSDSSSDDSSEPDKPEILLNNKIKRNIVV